MTGFGFEIRREDNTHEDPLKRGYGYRRGDLVAKYPLEQCQEDPVPGCPHFIVAIEGIEEDEANRLMEPELSGILKKTPINRRRWRLDVDSLPKSILRQLEATGRIELNWATAVSYFENKKSGMSRG